MKLKSLLYSIAIKLLGSKTNCRPAVFGDIYLKHIVVSLDVVEEMNLFFWPIWEVMQDITK